MGDKIPYTAKWRPDNWNNYMGDDGQKWAFERGADAMLKILDEVE